MIYQRYEDLQRYVGWTDADAARIRSIAPLVEGHFQWIVEDFYDELRRHPAAAKVIVGGDEQIARLKKSLIGWLAELFAGSYDAQYVTRRWLIGKKHVEVGVDQVFTNAAMSRLRSHLISRLYENWTGDPREVWEVAESLNRRIDLDLAVIEDAYESEHLQRERELERQRSESTFRDLVEAASCMIVILHPDGAIHYFSPFAEQATGLTAQEAAGKDFVETIVPPEEREAARESINQAARGERLSRFETGIVGRKGLTRSMLWNARRLQQFDEGPLVLAVGHDITSLKEAQQTALQSERLAAIGQMSTGLAHESRSALQRIQASTEMLELEIGDSDEAAGQLQQIQKSLDHLHRLFDEVRGYAAPITLDVSDFQLSGVWREAWELLTTERSGRQATLRENFPGVDVSCQADHFRLVQTFRNLLENAVSASVDPVQITIECEDAAMDGRPALRVAVCDNGQGMNEEQRTRAFEAFYTTKPKGTGLGMSIAQRNVEAHGGNIEIAESERGTRIVVTLPRKPA